MVPLLTVFDVQRSIDFYLDVLGFELEGKHPSDGIPSFATLRLGEIKLMLNDEFEPHERKPEHDRPRSDDVTFCFWTKDLESVRASLAEQGCRVGDIRVRYYGMKQLPLHDPDGYRLCLQEPTDDPPTDGHG
jgi:catechol 2,3-dioxygenase-like lactoylglutathione lyase family enzyme